MKYRILCLLWLWLAPITSQGQTIPPIVSGYGANGNFTMEEIKFPSPFFQTADVSIFLPREVSTPLPTIFFAPGFSVTNPLAYRSLIQHIVSRGYVVIFSPFQVTSFDVTIYQQRYNTIFAGFEEALRRYGNRCDTTRVGFIGHSFGGGASFAMLQRGVSQRGWGAQGLFLFSMAPWYVYEITTAQLVKFPANAKVVVQVYESDNVCDHRIGLEAFERLGLPASEKDFSLLRNDTFGNATLSADHGTPSAEATNALDYYGIWRTFDALADYALNGNPAGKAVALGDGSATQRLMGQWPASGTLATRPVTPSLAGDCVPVTRPSSSFTFRVDPMLNELSALSAASFRAPLAPESIATIFGRALAPATLANETLPLPLQLSGTTLRVRDSACVERLAPLFFVAPGQINFLVPAATAPGTATLIAHNEAGAVSLGTITIEDVAPGIFTANANGQGVPAGLALRVKADGTQVYESIARYDATLQRSVALPLNVSQPQEQVYLILFGTGWRANASLANVTASLGGVALPVLYAGAQGNLAGLDQLNLRVPAELAARGELELTIRIGGKTANPVRVTMQ